MTSDRPFRMLAALLAVLCLALTALVAPASAHPGGVAPGAGNGRSNYLALGDSVAFGFRPGAVTTPAQYADASNIVGYPEVVAARPPLRVTNASCPGETSGSLIDVTIPSNGCENGYRLAFPLHVAYTGSQLDFAVGFLSSHPSTQLVTINVGANDVFLCQRTTADHCTGSDFAAVLGQVGSHLNTILSTLRGAAGYTHQLVVLTYYATSYNDPAQVAGTQALNNVIVAAAQANGATVADGYTAFQAASAGAGGEPCAAGLLIALPSGGCDVHPTAAGHQVLADAVAGVLRGAGHG